MSSISILAAVGFCAATLVAAAGERSTPVRLVGENCPQVAPPGASIERDTATVDGTAAAPRNVCLVFFEADLDDSRG